MLRLARWSCRGFYRQPAEVRSGTPTRQGRTRATTAALTPPKAGSSNGPSTSSCTSSRRRLRRPRQVVVLSSSPFEGFYVEQFNEQLLKRDGNQWNLRYAHKSMEPMQTCCLLSRLELHVGYFIWTPICQGRSICSVQIQSTVYRTGQ